MSSKRRKQRWLRSLIGNDFVHAGSEEENEESDLGMSAVQWESLCKYTRTHTYWSGAQVGRHRWRQPGRGCQWMASRMEPKALRKEWGGEKSHKCNLEEHQLVRLRGNRKEPENNNKKKPVSWKLREKRVSSSVPVGMKTMQSLDLESGRSEGPSPEGR